MIESIEIRNFKSIVDLELPLGRFNVIIGPNGCGKSNILEAISMASAASQDKLDNEYLINRDVRISDPKFMVNAFEEDDDSEPNDVKGNDVISLTINSSSPIICNLRYNESMKKWVNNASIVSKAIHSILSEDNGQDENMQELFAALTGNIEISNVDIKEFKKSLEPLFNSVPELASFLVYRPSEHFLRKTFESTLFPLGVHGEGLLKYLKEAAEDDNVELFNEINEGLGLLDWFDGFKVPDNLMTNEYRLSIGDRYLKDSLHFFDQRSTNEGFLFLLFYLTLFNSKDTPSFFAVDDIESALNPKLIVKLTEYLIERCFINDKQVVVTTHNPFVLDSLDLKNNDVRLFVARRNIDGHTRIERVAYREDRKMSLSQLWMSGLIGGLPDNF